MYQMRFHWLTALFDRFVRISITLICTAAT